MKKSLFDKVIESVSPSWAKRRLSDRIAIDGAERNYKAVTRTRRQSNHFKPATNASRQAQLFADKLAGVSQDLVRNNPLAQRVKMIFASNIVGEGFNFDFTCGNKRALKRFSKVFEKWAESTDCDFDGHYNLSGLWWLYYMTMIETGGCFMRMHINMKRVEQNKFPLQFQLIEQTYLDGTKDKLGAQDEEQIVNGIHYDSEGQKVGYWIDIDPSGLDMKGQHNPKYYTIDKMYHGFRKERPGQHLGISWLAQIAPLLEKYDLLQDAKITQQQMAACLAILVEEAEQKLGTKSKSDTLVDQMEPGMIEYHPAGTKITTVTPPKVDDGSKFTYELKADAAVGAGINHQMLTGDYSKFNFASGQMGQIEFNKTLGSIHNFVAKPAIDWMLQRFIEVFLITEPFNCEFEYEIVFPPRTSVNPKETIQTEILKARNALDSPQNIARRLGTKLEKNFELWKQYKELVGDMPFDIDPEHYSPAGNQLDDNDSASANNDSNVIEDKPETNDDDEE